MNMMSRVGAEAQDGTAPRDDRDVGFRLARLFAMFGRLIRWAREFIALVARRDRYGDWIECHRVRADGTGFEVDVTCHGVSPVEVLGPLHAEISFSGRDGLEIRLPAVAVIRDGAHATLKVSRASLAHAMTVEGVELMPVVGLRAIEWLALHFADNPLLSASVAATIGADSREYAGRGVGNEGLWALAWPVVLSGGAGTCDLGWGETVPAVPPASEEARKRLGFSCRRAYFFRQQTITRLVHLDRIRLQLALAAERLRTDRVPGHVEVFELRSDSARIEWKSTVTADGLECVHWIKGWLDVRHPAVDDQMTDDDAVEILSWLDGASSVATVPETSMSIIAPDEAWLALDELAGSTQLSEVY